MRSCMQNAWSLAPLLLLGGCVRETFTSGGADVPVMLGPVDRIGGAPVARPDPEPTLDVGDSLAVGLNPSPLTTNIGPAIAKATRGPDKGPDPSATVHVNQLRTGTYVFWTIPYLTPIGLWREHWLKVEGVVEKKPAGT